MVPIRFYYDEYKTSEIFDKKYPRLDGIILNFREKYSKLYERVV